MHESTKSDKVFYECRWNVIGETVCIVHMYFLPCSTLKKEKGERMKKKKKKLTLVSIGFHRQKSFTVPSSTTGNKVIGIIEEHRQINQWPPSNAGARYRRAHWLANSFRRTPAFSRRAKMRSLLFTQSCQTTACYAINEHLFLKWLFKIWLEQKAAIIFPSLVLLEHHS